MSELIIPNLPELTFEEKTHRYILNNELEIPSVTKIMELLSYKEYGMIDQRILDNAANRGTIVHNAIENFIKYGIDYTDPEFQGYIDGFLDWWKQEDPKVIGSEIRTFHRILSYGGTIDLVAEIGGKVTMVDYKTTYRLVERNCRVQLEAYAQALKSHGINIERKMILHLSKDGKWKAPEFEAADAEAWRVFGSLKCLYDFMR